MKSSSSAVWMLAASANAMRPAMLRGIDPLRWVTDVLAVLEPKDRPYGLMTLGVDVELRPSAGKGMGVFARRSIGEEEVVGRYTGRLLRTGEFQDAVDAGENSGDYSFDIPLTDFVIDADDAENSGWPRYINHSVRRQNVETLVLQIPIGQSFTMPTGIVALRPIRPIAE
eukprot:1695182-Prymnesium_polylepis.1